MTNLVGILCGDKIFKRAFSCGLLFVLVSTLFIGSFTSVLAQGGGADSGGAANPAPLPIGGPGTFPIGGNGGGNTGGAVPGGNGGSGGTDDFRQTAADAANQQAALAAQGVGSTPDGVLGLFHTYVLTGLGWVVGQAGSAFDYAIENFIVGFGRLYITGTGETIDRLWGTVRDIFNLTFIFGLVYIGFKMILDSSDSSARKMLVSLIGAALLVNFSLFITKFVIDFSNIAATQVYNAFATDSASGQLSITNGFMTIMGINSLIGVEYTAGGSFAYVIGMLIIFAILAYVFLAGAIMIIIRFVALNIYMVFSPFMFLGWVFPALSGYSRDYWSGFLRQAFFAPAFIFMLYLSYVVASTFPAQRNLGTMFNPNGTSTLDVPSLIPYFAMVIVFLCASLVVAKKMGAHGSTMAINVGNRLRGNAQSFIGRNTVGRAASGMAKYQDTRAGRAASGFMTGASLGMFNNRAQRELYEKGKKSTFGGSYSRADDKSYSELVSSNISSENKKSAAAKAIALGLSPNATDEQKLAMQTIVAGMSTSSLESMKDSTRASIASSMTSAQVDALMKSEKIGNDDKAAIGKARKAAIEKLAGATGAIIHEEFNKLTQEQLETMGDAYIRDNAHLLTDGQLDTIKKSSKFNESQKSSFSASRKTKLDSYASAAVGSPNSATNIANIMAHKKPKDIAMLPANILMHGDAQKYLSDQVLREIAVKGTLTPAQQQQLEGMIARYPQHSHSTAQGYFGSNHATNNWG